MDDALFFLARFHKGALGSFMATRVAGGRRNMLRLEIFGSEGALAFNLERMNELMFYSQSDGESEQGFRTILVTEESHPYLSAWWPPGHILGWEHTFIHECAICWSRSTGAAGRCPASTMGCAASKCWTRR